MLIGGGLKQLEYVECYIFYSQTFYIILVLKESTTLLRPDFLKGRAKVSH